MQSAVYRVRMILVANDNSAFLGDDLIVWLLLALGGALFVGNVLALIRPPQRTRDKGDLAKAPRGRSLFMALIGLVVLIAALAALTSK